MVLPPWSKSPQWRFRPFLSVRLSLAIYPYGCRRGLQREHGFWRHLVFSNAFMVRNTADAKTCTQICSQTIYSNCDGEVSLYGRERKASKNGETVGFFYNYKCNYGANGGSEVSNADESVMGSGLYFSFCCCRKQINLLNMIPCFLL